MIPLKILCLHGYGVNGSFMDYQSRHLQKALSPLPVSFVFVDAPFLARPVTRKLPQLAG